MMNDWICKVNLILKISKFKSDNHDSSIMSFLTPRILLDFFSIWFFWYLRNFTFLFVSLREFMRDIAFFIFFSFLFLNIKRMMLLFWNFTPLICLFMIKLTNFSLVGLKIFLCFWFLNYYTIFPIFRPALMIILINIDKFSFSLSIWEFTQNNFAFINFSFNKLAVSCILGPIAFIIFITLFIPINTVSISFVLLKASLIAISIWVINLSFTTSLSFNKISLVCYKISIFPEGKLTGSMLLSILELTFINAAVLGLQNSVSFKFTIQKVSFIFFVFICQFSFSTSLVFIKFTFIFWSRGWCLFTCTVLFTLFKISYILAIRNKISQLSMTMKLVIFKLSNIM